MRKPDPPPGSEDPSRKKRSSAAAVMTTTRDGEVKKDDDDDNNDIASKTPPDQPPGTDNERKVEPHPIDETRIQTVPLSKKHRSRLPSDDEGSDGAEADEEYVPPGRSNWINLDGRKRHATSRRTPTTIFSPVIDTGTDTRRHSMAV